MIKISMQVGVKNMREYIKSKTSVQLVLLLAVCGIFNIQASLLKAEELHAHPGSIVFNGIQGHALNDTRSIFIFSSLGTTIEWSQSKNASWLIPDLQNGETDGILKIGVNTAGMLPGIYHGNITLESAQSSADPVVIAVTLIINPDVPVKITTWKDGYSSAMSVVVDDAQPSGFDELVANGFSGTYVTWNTSPPSFYTDYYNAGMELGSHTVDHPCHSVTDDVLRSQEIEPNISGIANNTPEPLKDIISFVWPCGYTNYREQAVTAEYFLCARGYNINQLEDATPENFMNLKSFNSHEHTPYPPADLKTVVDDAVSQKKWFNLVLHNYTNDDGAITYASSKDIWVNSMGTVIKYILQRDRFILTNYNSTTNSITYNVSRLSIPSSVSKNFEAAFGSNDISTMQIDVDDSRIIDNVLINGVNTPYQTKVLAGNKVLLANVVLDPNITKTVAIMYHPNTINLTISGVTANNKIYDRTTVATLNTVSAALIGIVPGDMVSLVTSGATGTFVNKNAGTNKSVSTSGFSLGGADASKYTLTQPTTTASITKADLSVSGIIANNKVYNGTTSATLNTSGSTLVGVFAGDAVGLVTTSASGNFSDKNVGTGKAVTISGLTLSGVDAVNYNLTQPVVNANITAAGVTVFGMTANNKIYDATTTAALNVGGVTLAGVFGTDVVTLNSSGAAGNFADKNAGTGKAVTASGFTLGGSDAANYLLTQPATTANITRAGLTISGVTASNRVYNGTTAAILNTGSATLVGIIGTDAVTIISSGATGNFVNKNVGSGKTVNISGMTTGGTDAGNYNLTQPSSTADITVAGLTISGVTADNKVYDGTTTATLHTGSAALVGIFGTDAVTLNTAGATGTFADSNIGTAKIVNTSGFAIGGTDSGNYTLTQPVTSADITGIILTVTGVTAYDKVYDRTTAANLNTGSATLVGVIASDVVTLVSSGATGNFSNKNTGTGKTVTTTGFALGGTDAGKYTLSQPTTSASITKASLTVSGISANNKVYNASTSATLNTGSATFVGIIGADAVTLVSSGATATFADKNVGTGKPVTISGLTLAGADAGNYTLTQPSSTADITFASLTVTGVTAYNKVYDGTTAATLNTGSAAISGVFGGDIASLISSGATGTFENPNVGTGKIVFTSGFTLGGSGSNNYTLIQPTTTADISGVALTITGVTANNKVYDATTTATLNTGSAALAGIVPGDVVSLVSSGATGTFANKNAGSGKSVSTSGFTLAGIDAGKYSLAQPATTADITRAGLLVSGVTANSKTYNGTTAATLNTGSGTLLGVFGGDLVSLVSSGATGTFSTKNTGTGIIVSTSGFTLGGADAGNYSLSQPSLTANITPANLTVSGVSANNKIYDRTITATLNTAASVLVGVYATDDVTLSSTGASGTFADKNAGTAKVVTTTGFSIGGSNAANYILIQPATLANITRAGLTILGATANNKVYNGTTAATLNYAGGTLSGVIGSDIVTLVSAGATGTFVNKNVGTGRSVVTSGFTLGGTDAANYDLTQPVLSANITAAGVTASGITANKVYDGTTTVTLNTGSASLSGIFGSDIVSLISGGATGTFVNKDAGTGKSVITSGFTLGGTDAANYTLAQPVITGNISAAGVTVSGITAYNKVYNGTSSATLNTGTANLIGVIGGDAVSLVSAGVTGNFANKNAGNNKVVSTSGFSLGGADAGNYYLTQPSTTANITPAGLTISGVTANSRVYNGTTVATLNTGSAVLSGIIGSDAVTLISTGASGYFVNKNTGTGKPVSTSGFVTGGPDGGNYTLTQPSSTANISAASLSISGVTANNKVYDGTTTATLNTAGASLAGVFNGDIVNLISSGATGTFINENVGTGKAVSTSGFTIGGTDSGNYTLTQPASSASISGIELTILGVSANNKVYDGTTAASLNTGSVTLSGVFGSDVVNLVSTGARGAFADKNVGHAKIVTTSGFAIAGPDAGNYTLRQPAASASVSIAELAITGVTAYNKVYNGTTEASLNSENGSLAGIFGTDNVTFIKTAAAGTFSNKDVGTGKTVSISGFTLGGADAGNYTLIQPSSAANITNASLTVSGVTASDKVYDATASATLNSGNAALLGVFGADEVSLVATASRGTFANKNAGTGKLVTISDFSLGGPDSGNYTLIQPTTTASITKVVLTITGVTANNKIYNGSATAILNYGNAALSGVLGADAVYLNSSGVAGTFNDKNVGTGKSVSISGFTLSGSDAGNYALSQLYSTANITYADLTISGVKVNRKIYDGTTTAILNTENATLDGVKGTDLVTLVSTYAKGDFADKNAGNGRNVTTSGFILSGPDAVNYNLFQPVLTADLLPIELTVTANDQIKHYKTTLTFTGVEITTLGLVSGDPVPLVTISSPGALASADVGKYPIFVEGGVSGNYNFTYKNGTMTVGKSVLIATADSKTKVYGSENPVLSVTYSGFYKNEDASVLDNAPVITTTANKTSNAGSYSISLSGGSDNNYDLALVDGTLNIVKAPLTITADNKTKVYREANPGLTITYSGFVLGQDPDVLDKLPALRTDANSDSDAGEYDIRVSGAEEPNYSFIYNNGTLAINKADQTITFEPVPSGLRMTQACQLKATASSDLEVSFEVSDPDIGTLNGNQLTVRKDGNLIIKATQGGDHNWQPAPEVIQSIVTLPTFDGVSSLFTPNNDGMNDYWYIPEIEQYGRLQVTVYNRFGQTVYHSESYKNDWDGTWDGYPLPAASYYYIIKSSAKGFLKGVVNIAR